MRITIVAIVAIFLGVGVGVAATVAEFGISVSRPTLSTPFYVAPAQNPTPPNQGPPPKLVVLDQQDYGYGEMEQNTVGRHVYVLRNDGDGVLDLVAGHACSCTVGSIARPHLAKGETTEVVLEWRPGMALGEFNRKVPITTNDPQQRVVELKIHGKVFASYRFDPPSLYLGPLSVSESREDEVKFLGFREDKCEILGHTWSDKKTAEFFGLVYEPLSAQDLAEYNKKLAAVDLKAKFGYRLTCAIHRGAPAGPLMQMLTLDTSLKLSNPATLQIRGNIMQDITVIGMQDFIPNRNILNLGPVSQGTARSAQLSLFIVGSHRNDLKFKVAKVVPPDLKVVIGPTNDMSGGHSQALIKVEVPPTAKPVDLRGTEPKDMGEIVIETTHPVYKELHIHVRVAVIKL